MLSDTVTGVPMVMHPTGLGKGLDALIRETSENKTSAGSKTLLLRNIIPNPNQPRRTFDQEALEELAASIKSQGLLQPILVRPLGPTHPGKYEIVAGERRWRASKMAGLLEVPVLIKNFTEQDMRAAALIENLQREDLNPLEEALALYGLKEEFNLSQDELAQKIGKSRPAVANSLRLLSLPKHVQESLASGKLSAGHARALLSVSDPEAQSALHELIQHDSLSVREAEGLASIWKEHGTFNLVSPTSPHSPADDTADGFPQNSEQPAGGYETAGQKHKKSVKSQSARLMEAQNHIGSLFQAPVKITGKEEKGKISISFNSREELEALLDRLSEFALQGQNALALPSSRKKQLFSQSRTALGESERTALEGNGNMALKSSGNKKLSGKKQTALDGSSNKALSGRSQQALRQTAYQSEDRESEKYASESAGADREPVKQGRG